MKRHRTGAANASTRKWPWEDWDGKGTPTFGERLPDGSVIELVRDPSDATKAMLLCRVGEQVTIADKIYAGDRIFVPAVFDPVLLRQLRLPCKDLPCGPTQALVDQISSIVMKTVEPAAENAFLVAVFAVASFFPDCLLTRLCLLLLGSANSEAVALLRVLSWTERLACRPIQNAHSIYHNLPRCLVHGSSGILFWPRFRCSCSGRTGNLESPGRQSNETTQLLLERARIDLFGIVCVGS